MAGKGAPASTVADERELPSGSAARSRARRGGGSAAAEGLRTPRGRPLGPRTGLSRPSPSPATRPRVYSSAMRAQPLLLELPAGTDVVDGICHFSNQRNVGLCIISASGSVASVTLLDSTASTFTLLGPLEILSLCGTVISCPLQLPYFSSPTSSPAPIGSPFAITLAGAQGQVIGGVVVGALIAASPVVVVATSFTSVYHHRMVSQEGGEGEVANAIVLRAEAAGPLSNYNQLLSSEIIMMPWSPTSRPPPPPPPPPPYY